MIFQPIGQETSKLAQLVWISTARQGFGDCKNSLNVGKSGEASLAVAGHLGVFAGLEAPPDGGRVDAQERGEVPGPIVGLIKNSQPITLDGKAFCV